MTTIKELLREYTPSGLLFKSGPRKGQEKPGKWHPVPFSRALEARPDECRRYAATDALATARIAMQLAPMLKLDGGWAERYYREFEKPLVPVLLSMEQAGVRVDPAALNAAGEIIDAARLRTEQSLRLVFGQEINLAGDDIKPILLELGIVDGRRTEAGGIAVGVPDILRTFRADTIDDLPTDTAKGRIARDLIEWRQMGKLRSTYVDALLRKRDHADRVHGRYNQAVANTNRLSSSDPNLQNIPSRSEIGMALRRAFIPRDGCVLVVGDYSQLQLRIYAEYTQEPVFLAAYPFPARRSEVTSHGLEDLAEQDFHQYAANHLKRPRKIVKNFVFAVLFGADEDKAAATAGVPKADVASFMAQLREEIPSLLSWKVRVSDTLAAKGYVESLQGWRGYFPDYWSSVRRWQSAALREAANFPIQSTEAGTMKRLMIQTYPMARRYGAQMVLQVHDEIALEVPIGLADEFMAEWRELGAAVGRIDIHSVPLRLDVKAVMRWGDAK